MKEQKLKISEESHGMHARPAAAFVKLAGNYPCEIYVIKDDIEVNGKSIMGLLMLALAPSEEFVIRSDGEMEEEALSALANLVQNNFFE